MEYHLSKVRKEMSDFHANFWEDGVACWGPKSRACLRKSKKIVGLECDEWRRGFGEVTRASGENPSQSFLDPYKDFSFYNTLSEMKFHRWVLTKGVTHRTCIKRITLVVVLRMHDGKARVEMKRLVRMVLPNSGKDMMKPDNRVEVAGMVWCCLTGMCYWICQQNLMEWL